MSDPKKQALDLVYVSCANLVLCLNELTVADLKALNAEELGTFGKAVDELLLRVNTILAMRRGGNGGAA